jgi:hypothetical protein
MMMLSARSRMNLIFLSGEPPRVLGRYLASTPAGYDGGARNRDVWHTKKAVLDHFRDFKAIEILRSHLHKNPLQRLLDTFAASEPKTVAFTSSAMKRSSSRRHGSCDQRARPSIALTTLQFPE